MRPQVVNEVGKNERNLLLIEKLMLTTLAHRCQEMVQEKEITGGLLGVLASLPGGIRGKNTDSVNLCFLPPFTRLSQSPLLSYDHTVCLTFLR